MRRIVITTLVGALVAATTGCVSQGPRTDDGPAQTAETSVATSSAETASATEPTAVQTTWIEVPDGWPTFPPPPPGAPTSGPVDRATGLRPSDEELAELRAVATEYFDLELQSPEYVAMAAADCVPQSWFGDLAAGRLSYDEFTLLSIRALSDDEPLLRPENICEGFDGDIQAWAFLSFTFWDALDTSTQAEVAQFWNGGIESATWPVGDADDYRAMIAALGTD